MTGVIVVPVIIIGISFLLGIIAAAAVLITRDVQFRRDLQQIEDGLAELNAGNLAYRIRTSGNERMVRVGTGINRFAETTQDEREYQARQQEAHRRLVTNISHDLRTPITSIAGYADALQRGIGDDPERYLSILSEKAGQLARLTDDLFYMSRIDSGDLLLKSEPVDICEIARQQLLGFEGQLTAAGVEVEFEAPRRRCTVSADESALRRVVDNIVSNALRHARGMTLLTVTLAVDGPTFRLTLADNGEGLGPDERRLFERGATGGGGGTGLGLAIARELAGGMGMALTAENGVVGGLVFELSGQLEGEGR